MGKVQCKRHGGAGTVQLCSHAAEIVDSGSFDHFYEVGVLGKLLVCERCYHQHGLERFQGRSILTEASDEEAEKLSESHDEACDQMGGTELKCAECVAAAEVNQARKAGRPDPFPVYERTLNSDHWVTLRHLEEHLVRNFDFHPSLLEREKQRRAVFASAGNYRKPMTVEVYYVTKRDEQEFIVKLVSAFLAEFSFNQCRIVFYEAEVINRWMNSYGGLVTQRGEENIIHEIFINC